MQWGGLGQHEEELSCYDRPRRCTPPERQSTVLEAEEEQALQSGAAESGVGSAVRGRRAYKLKRTVSPSPARRRGKWGSVRQPSQHDCRAWLPSPWAPVAQEEAASQYAGRQQVSLAVQNSLDPETSELLGEMAQQGQPPAAGESAFNALNELFVSLSSLVQRLSPMFPSAPTKPSPSVSLSAPSMAPGYPSHSFYHNVMHSGIHKKVLVPEPVIAAAPVRISVRWLIGEATPCGGNCSVACSSM